MRLFPRLLASLGFALVALSAAASPASPQNGQDYRTLEQPQQTAPGNKVEVTEFFWYNCPHCNAFEPALEDWVKKQGDKIVFKRVPIAFRDSFIPQQKLYYTLEALGQVDELHKKVFYAIHVERQRLDTDNEIADFIGKQGVDKKKFLDMYNSFAVQTKVRQATQLQAAYQVDGVPLVAINGRYLTSPSIVGASIGNRPEAVLQSSTLQVMDFLVAKAAKERAPVAASAAPAPKKK
ncbi:MAG TPA: thiol:disulfide interchange protein DsbA/DsbL [Burkholderiaceae bacterium]|nr:thiol:disulfide interchange protein DsbA/DsbL [Burkholderiaceae bacterium]